MRYANVARGLLKLSREWQANKQQFNLYRGVRVKREVRKEEPRWQSFIELKNRKAFFFFAAENTVDWEIPQKMRSPFQSSSPTTTSQCDSPVECHWKATKKIHRKRPILSIIPSPRVYAKGMSQRHLHHHATVLMLRQHMPWRKIGRRENQSKSSLGS